MRYTITLTKKELERMQNILRSKVQEFYDNPYGVCCDGRKEIIEYHKELKCVVKSFYLNFNMVVEVEATKYEKDRMNEIIFKEK